MLHTIFVIIFKIIASFLISWFLNQGIYFIDRYFFSRYISKEEIAKKSDQYNGVGLISWPIIFIIMLFL